VTVSFYPDAGGRPATGIAGPDGRFSLSSVEPNDGTTVGTHKVAVTEPDKESLMPGMQGYDKGKRNLIVDAKYGEPQTSGLMATVGEHGEKALEIHVEPRMKK
jgi:hypothetical protein